MNVPHFDPSHQQIRDDLGPYALGSLEPAAAARVAAHIPTCAECAAILRDYQAVVHYLPTELPLAQLPAGARERLLARARGDEVVRPAPVARPNPSSWQWLRTPNLQLALVAALLLILTGAGVAMSEEFGAGRVPYRRTYDMWGAETAPDAAGLLVYGSGGAKLVVAGMPDLEPGRAYQLWFVTADDDEISGAVFSVDERGTASVPVEVPEEARDYRGCTVTEEPYGGSDWPTGDDVLVGPQWGG